jgi:hypothetical protein
MGAISDASLPLPQLQDGLAYTVLEMLKGVEHGFHSTLADRLPLLLQLAELASNPQLDGMCLQYFSLMS